MVKTPILFATFARPEYARLTFAAIKKAKPEKLYFYSNKAREGNLKELERNNEVRALVNEIDWECDVKTYYRLEYVDIYESLFGAYDWIFENEEQAIILEEDCVPSLAFFDFCDQLLPKYKLDQRIWHISGNNFIEGYNPSGYDYIFSPFAYQYGWASWRNRWQKMIRTGIDVNEIVKSNLYQQIYSNRSAVKAINRRLKRIKTEDGLWKIDAWDYMFQMTMRVNGGFGIVPLRNLVSNIGKYGEHNSGGTIFNNWEISDNEKYIIDKHPVFIVSDARYTNKFYKKIAKKDNTSFLLRVYRFIIRKTLSIWK